MNCIHPRKLRWNLKFTQLKRNIIFQTSIFFGSMLIFQGVDQSLTDRMCWFLHLVDISTSISGMIVLHDVLWFASWRGCTALDFNQDQFAMRIARKNDRADELYWNLAVLSNFWEWSSASTSGLVRWDDLICWVSRIDKRHCNFMYCMLLVMLTTANKGWMCHDVHTKLFNFLGRVKGSSVFLCLAFLETFNNHTASYY